MNWFDVTFQWYLATTAVTIALAPFSFLVFRHLVDRGASFARPVAALVMIWPAWFLAGIGSGIVPFGPVSLWATVAVVGASSWVLAWRNGTITRDTIKHLLFAEAVFVIAFALFIWFHGYGPAITDQEKPSELMMLSSVMRAEQMPPEDAWLAGYTINYYYLGYVIWGAFGNLIGTSPAVAFNLALATIFGMSVVGAAGLTGTVLGRWFSPTVSRIGAALGGIFVIILGNPWAAARVIDDAGQQWNAWFFEGIGWESTRIINDGTSYTPISEFPAFSFVLSDLHPHLMALPYAITALGCAWMLTTLRHDDGDESFTRRHWPRLLIGGGLIGALYALNSWDFPTYLMIALLGLAIGTTGTAWRDRALGAGILVASSIICWLPFYASFESPTRAGQGTFADAVGGIPVIGGVLASIAGYQAERTSLTEYLSIFGFMYVVALLLIAVESNNRRNRRYDPSVQRAALATTVILLLGALLVPAPLLILCGLPLVAIVLLIERDMRLTAANVALGLFGIAFLLNLIPEFFYLLDIYTDRMNTIFKVYYQVWLLMGIASGIAVIALCQFARTIQAAVARFALPAVVAVILLGGAAFPVVAGHQWLNWRSPEREWVGVDGLAYLNQQGPVAQAEYEALQWLWENGEEDDVLLAAGGCDWTAIVGRPAGASGIPTLLGWYDHEEQWHLADPDFRAEVTIPRTADIVALFEEPTANLLDQYGVMLVYVGVAELEGAPTEEAEADCAPGPFPNATSPQFPGPGWNEVFSEGDVRIYRRDGS